MLSPEESPLIERFGVHQGSIVPRLIPAEGDDRFSWRFTEPPIEMNPNRPWVLYQGEPIADPEQWMTKTAIVVLATMSRYHDAVIAANPVFRDDEVPPALAELVTESALEVQVRLRREQLHLRYNGLLRIPYDYGVIAVDVRSPDEAYVYGWTFGNNWRLRGRTDLEFGDLVDNAQFTDHTLSLLRSNEGGTVAALHPLLGAYPLGTHGHSGRDLHSGLAAVPALLRVERRGPARPWRHGIRGVVRGA